MNCSVYSSSFQPYRNVQPHPTSSFRIDDILKAPASSSTTPSIDSTHLWSSFAAQLLSYSPEILSLSSNSNNNSTQNPMILPNMSAANMNTGLNHLSPPIPNLTSPTKHHRPQYHPYLSTSRHSPTAKLQHDPTSMLTISTNKNNYQHALSPLSIKEKIHQSIDRKDCLSSLMVPISHHPITASPSSSTAAAMAAYWPYLYSRCHSSTTTTSNNSVSRRKGGQIRFSAEQSLQLEKKFEISQYLSPVERKQIAKTLQLSERQIKTWFQNRRAKHRRSAATVTKKDMDKSCSTPHQTDDEDDDDDEDNDDNIDIEDNADEEHASSSNSN